MGSNPGTIYWMDMTLFTLICCKKFIVCLKRPKINKREARVGPFFEKIKAAFIVSVITKIFTLFNLSPSMNNMKFNHISIPSQISHKCNVSM